MASYIKKNRIVLLIVGIVLVGLSVLLSSHEKMKDITKTNPIKTSRSIKPPHKGNMQPDFDFGKFPLYFIKNQGQFNQKARFYVKTSHCTLWITREGLLFDAIRGDFKKRKNSRRDLNWHLDEHRSTSTKTQRDVSGLIFRNANKNPEIVPVEKTKLKVNYFKGNDRSKWVCDVPTSLGVLYKNLYNNIDLKVYGIEKQVEYDWIVRPGGNPEDIRFHLKNIKSISIDKGGNLVIETSLGKVKHKKPVAFQMIKNKKVKIKSRFKRIGKGKNIYGFFIGTYDKNHELIIDPVYLSYSTYLGGSSEDRAYDIAVDSGDNYVYVTGFTWSANFPTLNQYQGNQSYTDAFITKIDTSQSGSSSLLYSTYLGGDGTDSGWSIAADSSGIVYITGLTGSSDFPTLNQYQTNQLQDDVFVTKIDTTQSGSSSLLYSTYLGGNSYDRGYGIAIDSSGNAYVSGTTNSTDFPTLNQYQTDQSYSDIFVTKLDTTQSGSSCLVYSTYLGGSYYDFGNEIALDSSGYVYVIGETWSSNFPLLNQYQGYQGMTDVVISKLDTGQSGSSSLLYSTYLGGSSDDYGRDIAADSSGNAYVTGSTTSTNFPLLNQYQSNPGNSYEDAFVTKIDTTQSGSSSLIYSTYLSGDANDRGNSIAVDNSGNAYVTGYTYSTNFPILNQFQSDPGDSTSDAFVTKLNTTQSGSSSLVYSTYLGGSDQDEGYGIAINDIFVYVCGYTLSTNFPTARPYQTDQTDWDAFVTKLYDSADTLVMVSDFSVNCDGGQAVVQWETSSEIGTIGFHLFRKDKDDKTYQRVNHSLLVGLLTSPQGGVYRVVDPGVSFDETCTYKLVEIESGGGRRIYGPFEVTVGKTDIGHMDGRYLRRKKSGKTLTPMMGSYAKERRRMTAVKKARLAAMKEDRNRFKLSQIKSVKGTGKIAIKQNGLYLLRAEDISDVLGLHPHQVYQMIMQQRLRLTNKGKDVTWLPTRANAGIYFYGEGIDSLFTDTNIYWLEKDKGHLMDAANGGCPPATSGQTFTDHLHIEKDLYSLTALFDNPNDDYWLWDYIVSGHQSKQFSFFLHGVSPAGNPSVTVNLQGATATPHHVKVKLNGTEIGESSWQDTAPHHFTISFDQSLLHDGENFVEVQGILSGDATYSIFYVDSFDLKYGRYYLAFNNRLFCRSDHHSTVTVGGFASRNIMVFDVSNAFSPKLVSGTFIDQQNRVSFVPAFSETRYLVVDESGVSLPHSIIADSPSHLKKNNPWADYIVIVPEGFEEAAGELINLRRWSGLEGLVVCLEDIYDEFNHGLTSPWAIKEFLSYAYNRWNGSNLKYVVLAGEGTFDYKDNLGYGENLIPPIMVSTPRGLFAADNQYGDVRGEDGIPDIAVGRLPVATEEEFRSYIKKLSDYEDASGGWTDRVIMVADNQDWGGDFPSDSDRLSQWISGYDVEKIYLPDFSDINQAREKLFQSINLGAALINYLGHAGLDSFTQEGLFEMEDVNDLQNENRLPVLTAMTCVAGRFSLPGFDTLSEALILRKNGGVIAVWGPTGASSNFLACNLAEDFFNNIFQSDKKILGSAVLQAIRNFTHRGGPLFMVNIYTLLGDPTLEIK
jgi:hypothetical protein